MYVGMQFKFYLPITQHIYVRMSQISPWTIPRITIHVASLKILASLAKYNGFQRRFSLFVLGSVRSPKLFAKKVGKH